MSALLDRVRKLLALATSPNVHEAAAAAAAAQALITRHRLEALLAAPEIAPPFDDGRDDPLDAARRARVWKIVLADALAEANGCVVWTTLRGDDELLLVAGHPDDRAAVRALWDALVRRVEWLSATHGPGKPKKWHDAFRVGVVDAIRDQLAAPAGPAEAALTPVDPSLHARRAAVEDFVERHLRGGKGRPLRVDAAAWRRGRQTAEASGFAASAPLRR
jgi:hypothetical protein